MKKSNSQLPAFLADLTAKARARSLTDTDWSARAGVRNETLSRLRRRSSCDLSTLQALAAAVGARLVIDDGAAATATTPDGHFPASLDRNDEARLLKLAASGNLAHDAWTAAGPRFFMAGLAVMLAGEPGLDRRGLLALAEHLHPGATEPAVFTRWLERSPLRPSRFLPLLAMERKHAA
ncbi:hypothetical protein [Luteimonas sp. R10]|uniref:hypothetical protein n=1 Tax=Luteimonas sp. R10 TaxID=3108176 RepID=UPI0030891A88|nr:hypothetical protein U3649_18410 [Luteimonas sp. R10]